MLRLLHTSDWHLGAPFHDLERDLEEQHALEQLIALAKTHAVDAVLIAGDVFDTVNPPAAAQRRYFQTLLRLVDEAGVGSVIVIGGNHDHGLRLDGPRELLQQLRLHVRGQLRLDTDPADVVLPVHDRQGHLAAWIAAVPYLREGDVLLPVGHQHLADLAQRQGAAQRERLAAIAAALTKAAGDLPRLAMAHGFAVGGQASGDERPVAAQVGNLGGTDFSMLAAGCSYAAFGHLHRPQIIAGQPHWRYSGSLLPMAFDEATTPRQAVLVEIAEGGPAHVRCLELAAYRRYLRFAGPAQTVTTALLQTPPRGADEPEPWVEIQVHQDGPDPSAPQRLSDTASRQGFRVLRIVRRRPQDAGTPTLFSSPADEPLGLEDCTPETVFTALHQGTYGTSPDPSLRSAFDQLLQRVRAM
jgi:exonuclease SbcD